MKRLPIVALAVCFAGLVACNQASAGGSFNQQARLDNLEKDFKQVKEEFEIIKYALDKRGISLEQARAEMEADNKVWDIPDEDSPVFGNTKNPKLTIVEFTEFQCPYCSRIAPVMEELNKITREALGVEVEILYMSSDEIMTATQAGKVYDMYFTCSWFNSAGTNFSVASFHCTR